jgi:hypothetical protein
VEEIIRTKGLRAGLCVWSAIGLEIAGLEDGRAREKKEIPIDFPVVDDGWIFRR